MRERLLPVHCCCEPGKRLGYLPVREDDLRGDGRGRFVAFAPMLPFVFVGLDSGAASPVADRLMPDAVRLRLRLLKVNTGLAIAALDSGHQPLDVLRTLPGWIDAR